MEPLEVRAVLSGPICMPDHPLALDGLLGAAVCVRDDISPATTAAEVVPLDIPIARSACGRVYLASCAQCEAEEYELRYTHKRAPIEQYQTMGGPKLKTVNITAGANKGYRIPRETAHLVDDAITWWCVGDAAEVSALLRLVHHLGKRRAVGLGRVREWSVQSVEPWDGFPVLHEGEPLRPLPTDFPGLAAAHDVAYAVLQPPYWDNSRSELCAVPTALR